MHEPLWMHLQDVVTRRIANGDIVKIYNERGTVLEGATSKNATGMAVSSFLVEVEKVTMSQMEEWKGKYPAAFERKYDPAAGLRFDAWIKGAK